MILVIDETEDLRNRISGLYPAEMVRRVPDLTDARLVLEDPTAVVLDTQSIRAANHIPAATTGKDASKKVVR